MQRLPQQRITGAHLPTMDGPPNQRELTAVTVAVHLVRIKQRFHDVRHRVVRSEGRARLLRLQVAVALVERSRIYGDGLRDLCAVTRLKIQVASVARSGTAEQVDG